MASGVIERLSALACGDSSSPEEAVTDERLSALACGDSSSPEEAVTDERLSALACGDSSSPEEAVTDALLSALACGDSSSPEEAVIDALLSPPEIREAKISSDKENLIVVLERAPKIISLYRGLAPGAVIVGFKLLSDVSEEELVRAGHALLLKNDCDFVLANDLRTVRSDCHEGLLIARDGTFERAAGKEVIAALIVHRALDCI